MMNGNCRRTLNDLLFHKSLMFTQVKRIGQLTTGIYELKCNKHHSSYLAA